MSVDDDIHLAVGDDVEAVADVALSEELLPEASRTGRSTCARLSCVCRQQQREQLDAAKQLELPLRDWHRVQLGEPAAQEDREGRPGRARNQQRAADLRPPR